MLADPRARLEHERAQTVEQVDALVRSFDEIVEAATDVATDDEHDPEGHTIAYERQQVAGLLRDTRSYLVEINSAVGRVDAGTYGTCESCGVIIGDDRLDALPAARTCIECAV
jgi:DnaK suppressor protein